MRKSAPTQSSSGKAKGKWFDFNRIKDKLIVIVVVIITVLTLITTIATIQNFKTQEVLSTISKLRIPVPILTADILSGANRVSASQRAYIMTGDEKYKQERLEVWRDQIEPAAIQLEALKELMKVSGHRKVVDEITDQLTFYKNLQQEIDEFYEKELKSISLGTSINDSTDLRALVDQVREKDRLNGEINLLVAGDASQARKKLRRILTPLNQAQETLLMEDNSAVIKRIRSSTGIMMVTSVIGILLIIIFSSLLLKSLGHSISKPTELLTAMSQGSITGTQSHSRDELNDIFQATNMLSANMLKASQFALDIGEGNFDQDFKPASENDTLGNALIQMRNRLSKVAEEDRKRNWAAQGLAQLAEILRNDIEDIKEFSNNIILQVVNYAKANQGSLFIVNNDSDKEYMELQGCYAWDRTKHLKKKIYPNEGLVGQVWLEGETIYMEDFPDDHVKIRSGLGDANPTSILIAPIKTDNGLEGVMELAFFHRLENYQLEFIEKICANIASAISSVKINHRTQHLLQQAQQQAEELRSQEEEMRQNMEELTATQEEMNRVQSMARLTLEGALYAVVSIDESKSITFFNKAAEDMFGFSRDEVMGRNVKVIVPLEHRAQHDSYIENNIATGVNKVVGIGRDLEMVRKDGSSFMGNLALSKVQVDGAVQYTAFIRYVEKLPVHKALDHAEY